MEKIIMTRKETEQMQVMEQLLRKEIKQETASEMLSLSIRQIRNKVSGYRLEGAKSLVHKSRGRPSKKKWDREQEDFAMDLLKNGTWYDFGPTFAAEKLLELYGIKISIETLRTRMIAHGIRKTRKHKKEKRKLRERKKLFGIMVQLDGSPHTWFGDGKYTLLVFIDDATSTILHLEFANGESVEDLMRATKAYLEKYGRPISFYVDHGSVFHVNLNNPEHDKRTQWERAMKQLDVEVIHAHSPQAKGRVERSNGTHQDRLIKELRLAGITTLEGARSFLPGYIEKHNRKFAYLPAEEGNAHRSILEYDLASILCEYSPRKIRNDYTIQYNKRIFQLTDERNIVYKPKDEVIVKERLDKSIAISIRGRDLEYKELSVRPEKQHKEKVCNNTNSKTLPRKRCNNDWIFKKKPYYYQPRIY